MLAQEILGLDIGQKHIGIARASNIAKIAEPLKSVATDKAVKELINYLKEHQVEAIAVGLPRNLSGDDTEQTRFVRLWADQAKQRIKTPLYWQDEALTSQQASKSKEITNDKVDDHALAAAIILQDFIDTPPAARQVC